MWVVLCVHVFEFEPQTLNRLPVIFDTGKMVGYLPVYENKEDALRDFPNHHVMEIISKDV